jgi:hypothetical protein
MAGMQSKKDRHHLDATRIQQDIADISSSKN